MALDPRENNTPDIPDSDPPEQEFVPDSLVDRQRRYDYFVDTQAVANDLGATFSYALKAWNDAFGWLETERKEAAKIHKSAEKKLKAHAHEHWAHDGEETKYTDRVTMRRTPAVKINEGVSPKTAIKWLAEHWEIISVIQSLNPDIGAILGIEMTGLLNLARWIASMRQRDERPTMPLITPAQFVEFLDSFPAHIYTKGTVTMARKGINADSAPLEQGVRPMDQLQIWRAAKEMAANLTPQWIMEYDSAFDFVYALMEGKELPADHPDRLAGTDVTTLVEASRGTYITCPDCKSEDYTEGVIDGHHTCRDCGSHWDPQSGELLTPAD